MPWKPGQPIPEAWGRPLPPGEADKIKAAQRARRRAADETYFDQAVTSAVAERRQTFEDRVAEEVAGQLAYERERERLNAVDAAEREAYREYVANVERRDAAEHAEHAEREATARAEWEARCKATIDLLALEHGITTPEQLAALIMDEGR